MPISRARSICWAGLVAMMSSWMMPMRFLWNPRLVAVPPRAWPGGRRRSELFVKDPVDFHEFRAFRAVILQPIGEVPGPLPARGVGGGSLGFHDLDEMSTSVPEHAGLAEGSGKAWGFQFH